MCTCCPLLPGKTWSDFNAVVLFVILSPVSNTHDEWWSPRCDNVTSSTKPEVCNVLQHHLRRNYPLPNKTKEPKFWHQNNTDRVTEQKMNSFVNYRPLRGGKELVRRSHTTIFITTTTPRVSVTCTSSLLRSASLHCRKYSFIMITCSRSFYGNGQ